MDRRRTDCSLVLAARARIAHHVNRLQGPLATVLALTVTPATGPTIATVSPCAHRARTMRTMATVSPCARRTRDQEAWV